jgi:hypothetical protein
LLPFCSIPVSADLGILLCYLILVLYDLEHSSEFCCLCCARWWCSVLSALEVFWSAFCNTFYIRWSIPSFCSLWSWCLHTGTYRSLPSACRCLMPACLACLPFWV